jgi:hypothetical protein
MSWQQVCVLVAKNGASPPTKNGHIRSPFCYHAQNLRLLSIHGLLHKRRQKRVHFPSFHPLMLHTQQNMLRGEK